MGVQSGGDGEVTAIHRRVPEKGAVSLSTLAAHEVHTSTHLGTACSDHSCVRAWRGPPVACRTSQPSAREPGSSASAARPLDLSGWYDYPISTRRLCLREQYS